MNIYAHAESNARKTWFYLFFFLLLVISVGWIISYFLQSPAILYFAVILSIVLNFLAYWHSDKIVLKLSGAKPIEKKDNPELYRLVENLCITAGLPLPRIYIIDSVQPNAFATGRDEKHGVVAVTKGLLDKLERAELEGVIAHELSHIGNKDILLQTIVVVLFGFVVILTDFFFRIAFWGSMGGNSREGGQIKLFMILIALALAVLAPIFAQLIKLAISRKREYLADASAVLLTRHPEGLARALEKIQADTNVLKKANNATSHLYIANPFKGKEKKSWLHGLFATHPPIEERVKALRSIGI
jgi:heat shock protein HtpX